jgi:hypothetical protein
MCVPFIESLRIVMKMKPIKVIWKALNKVTIKG